MKACLVGCCFPCFQLFLCHTRRKVQNKYGITELDTCEGCLGDWCCSFCSVIQLKRETGFREGLLHRPQSPSQTEVTHISDGLVYGSTIHQNSNSSSYTTTNVPDGGYQKLNYPE
eukprot:Awhi_evm1s7332